MAERILHICPRPSFSGLEAYAFDMALGQSVLGADVTMVVLAGSPLAQKCRENRLPYLEIQAHAVSEVWRYLKKHPAPDIIHLHSTQDLKRFQFMLLGLRFRARRARVVMQTHIWISHSKRDPLHSLTYALVDEVWCSSEPARQALVRNLPIAADKIRILNYGRDVGPMEEQMLDRSRARHELGLPEDALVIGTVARIDKGKGTHELLEGALLAMAKNPLLHLVMIGPPTADDPAAIQYARGIEERVNSCPEALRRRLHVYGSIPQTYRFLKAFDLYALATYRECFSLALLEAQLAGLPSVATESGGTPSLVQENHTGWLFQPESVDSLYQALERALQSREAWPELGRAARSRVLRDFDFKKLLPQTLTNYRKLLART